jgi:hypothetical protein
MHERSFTSLTDYEFSFLLLAKNEKYKNKKQKTKVTANREKEILELPFHINVCKHILIASVM